MTKRNLFLSSIVFTTSLIVGAFTACSGGGGGGGSVIGTKFVYVKPAVVGTDLFGSALALSGDGQTMVVGAPNEASAATGINGDATDNSLVTAGAAYVFVRSGNTWVQQAYLKASNTGADQFGISVAISQDGNTIAVGAYLEASNATGVNGDPSDNSVASAGAVYVFTRSSGTWSQEAYIKASNTGAGDLFGTSVALSHSGNTLAVGARTEDSNATGINGNEADNSATNSGAVYVFERSAGTWTQQAYVKASNTDAQDNFGSWVALSGSGDDLVVGAFGEASNATGVNGNEADNSASSAGAASVFKRSGSSWSQQAYLKASNTEAGDLFGLRFAISGDGTRIAIGALQEGSAAQGINGNQADNSEAASGAVYVFNYSASQWQQEAYIKSSNSNYEDDFGAALALSNDGATLAVGAYSQDYSGTRLAGVSSPTADNSGAVYTFKLTSGAWSQQMFLKPTNTETGDSFGKSLALDDSGSVLAASSYLDDSNATGINGDANDNSLTNAGSVHVIW